MCDYERVQFPFRSLHNRLDFMPKSSLFSATILLLGRDSVLFCHVRDLRETDIFPNPAGEFEMLVRPANQFAPEKYTKSTTVD